MSQSTPVKTIPTKGQLEPTQYNLQGYDIQISYATTSFTGEPRFTFNSPTESRTFSGSEIIVEKTQLGQIVTVMLKNNAADEGFEGVTLLLPVVRLTSETQQIAIQTFAILNKRVLFVAPGARQLQQYNPVFLTGTAEYLVF